jgi:hypothetical protein
VISTSMALATGPICNTDPSITCKLKRIHRVCDHVRTLSRGRSSAGKNVCQRKLCFIRFSLANCLCPLQRDHGWFRHGLTFYIWVESDEDGGCIAESFAECCLRRRPSDWPLHAVIAGREAR